MKAYLCSWFDVFCHYFEVVPVHKPFHRACIILKVQIVLIHEETRVCGLNITLQSILLHLFHSESRKSCINLLFQFSYNPVKITWLKSSIEIEALSFKSLNWDNEFFVKIINFLKSCKLLSYLWDSMAIIDTLLFGPACLLIILKVKQIYVFHWSELRSICVRIYYFDFVAAVSLSCSTLRLHLLKIKILIKPQFLSLLWLVLKTHNSRLTIIYDKVSVCCLLIHFFLILLNQLLFIFELF